MEIGLEQQDGWPTSLRIGSSSYSLKYEVRSPTYGEKHQDGIFDHVWNVYTVFNGETVRAGGQNALEAVMRLAEQLNHWSQEGSNKVEVELPVSWVQTQRACLRPWNR